MEEMLKDKRFAHIAKDPKFRRIPKSERKVKIDKRFQSMFNDKQFTVKYTIDKRGRPINQTSTENLRKYYDLSSSDEGKESSEENSDGSRGKKEKGRRKEKKKGRRRSEASEDATGKSTVSKEKKQRKLKENKSKIEQIEIHSETELNENSEDDDSDATTYSKNEGKYLNENEKVSLTKDIKEKLRDLTVDYARGEGVLLTDSSSEEESSDQEEDEEEEIEHDWGELDKEAETTEEITHRLAACNMDWDRIRAVDLMVLFNSFLAPGGLIHSVTIYPSDFGLKRLEEEEVKGPIELVEVDKKRKDAETDDENEEGSEYHREKMRQYQLNRLKYYYAVVDCNSPETANKIYTECDGIEYESTSTKLDLRFIPDDMEFQHEPKEVCEKLPELSKYQPRLFTTTALQQVKVELTWDETNQERQEITQKINSGKLDEIDETDIQAYLASGTSEDDSEDDEDNIKKEAADDSGSDTKSTKNPLDKYKSLLKSIEDHEEAKKNNQVKLEFTWGLGTKEKAEKLVKERRNKVESLTPFEQYLEKRKSKKKAKKAQRKKSRDENDDNTVASDSDDSVPSDVDTNDPYFAEEMKNIKSKKRNKKKSRDTEDIDFEEDEDVARKKAELELLLLDKGDEEGKRHFDIKKIEDEAMFSKSKRKRMSKKNKNSNEIMTQDDFEVDVADPRFGAIYSSHHFNIDPADPRYRKTKGTEALVAEKLKRRGAVPNFKEDMPVKQPKRDDGKMSADLAALVKSVKRNTKNILKPIK